MRRNAAEMCALKAPSVAERLLPPAVLPVWLPWPTSSSTEMP